MTHRLVVTMLAACLAGDVSADIVQVQAEGNVDEVMERLEVDVSEAGATIFAKVDHGAGAESVGMPIGDSQLLIFGNPKLGTPAIADDPLAGLVLPLKVLVFDDRNGQTWIAYEEVDDMFDDLDVDDDAQYVETIETVLRQFVEGVRSE